MQETHWIVGSTKEHVHAAQRLRWQCLRGRAGSLGPLGTDLDHDVSAADNLPHVQHLLVYRGECLLGTARLTFPSPEVARAQGTACGFELERMLDLQPLGIATTELAEVSRVCVLPGSRGAAAKLYEALYVRSRQRGVRYFVGGVDCRTSDHAEALVMYCRAKLLGWSRGGRPARPRPGAANGHGSAAGATDLFYPPGPKLDPRTARVAPAIEAFARRLGARTIGVPVLNRDFSRYVLPMLVDLEKLPEHTLERFEPRLRPTPVMTGLAAALLDVAREGERRLDEHPVGKQLIAGTLPGHAYATYLSLVAQQVRHASPLLRRAGRRLQLAGRKHLAELLCNKADEESGHDRWALEDLEALGVPRSPARSSARSSAVRAHAAVFGYLSDTVPAAVLGLAYVLEWFAAGRAALAADNLVKVGAIPRIASAVRFLREHGKADPEHLKAFVGPLQEITCPSEARAILSAARVTTDLYLGLLEAAGASLGFG